MNRISPFTYFVGGMLSTAVANTVVTCSDIEFLTVNPPSGQTCGDYLNEFITTAGSTLVNPDASSDCQICLLSSTNQFLTAIGAKYSERWRNFGIIFAYIGFNICAAVLIYWLARVPKNKKPTEIGSQPPSVNHSKENVNDEKVNEKAV